MIVAVALVILPVVILGPSEDGTVKLISNVSFPSTTLSFITAIFTAPVLSPAVIVAICILESKSVLFPKKFYCSYESMKAFEKNQIICEKAVLMYTQNLAMFLDFEL